MQALLRNVEKQLANILPDSFGIVIDGWTESGTHFLATYTSFVDKFSGQVKQYHMGNLWNVFHLWCRTS